MRFVLICTEFVVAETSNCYNLHQFTNYYSTQALSCSSVLNYCFHFKSNNCQQSLAARLFFFGSHLFSLGEQCLNPVSNWLQDLHVYPRPPYPPLPPRLLPPRLPPPPPPPYSSKSAIFHWGRKTDSRLMREGNVRSISNLILVLVLLLVLLTVTLVTV